MSVCLSVYLSLLFLFPESIGINPTMSALYSHFPEEEARLRVKRQHWLLDINNWTPKPDPFVTFDQNSDTFRQRSGMSWTSVPPTPEAVLMVWAVLLLFLRCEHDAFDRSHRELRTTRSGSCAKGQWLTHTLCSLVGSIWMSPFNCLWL